MEKRRDIPRSTIQTHTSLPLVFGLCLCLCLWISGKNWKFRREYDMTCCLLSLWVSVFLRRNRISLQTQKGSLKRTWKLTNLTWPPKVLPSLCSFFLFFFLIYLFFSVLFLFTLFLFVFVWFCALFSLFL